MSLDEIRTEIEHLPNEEVSEIIAFALHLKNQRNPELIAESKKRLEDDDSDHWLTPDEFEKRLDAME